MIKKSLLFIALFSCSFGWASETETQETAAASTTSTTNLDSQEIRKISEAFGHLIGSNLKNPGITFDVNSIIEGIRNASEGKPSPMTTQEYEEAMSGIQEIAFNEMANQNLEKANRFMTENRNKNGIIEIEEGKVQYEVLQNGSGNEISEASTPVINYKGSYLDGTVFGSSETTGGPITLPLNQTISGFSKALVGMKEGEKRRIFIHPDEGYGKFGHLEPNALLTFEVEIIKSDSSENRLSEMEEEFSAEASSSNEATVR